MKFPFASHLGTKIMAVVLAVFLWGFAYWENLREEDIPCKVTFSAPQGLQVDPPYKEISLEVKGPRRRVEDLRNEGVVYLTKKIEESQLERFAGADEMSLQVTISAADLKTEGSLTFDLPREIPVTVRRIGQKELTVRIRTAGRPAPGYVYIEDRSSAWPPKVRVRGPKSLLENTEYIETEEFYLTGLSAQRTEKYRLVSKIDGEDVTISQDEVWVTVHIEQESAEEKFEKIPVRVAIDQGYPYRVTTEPTTVSITVRGPAETVGSLDPDTIVVFARVESTLLPSENPYPEDIQVAVPDQLQGIISVTTDQKIVSIKVESPVTEE